MELYYVLLLGISMSADAFFAGTAYGFKGIHLKGSSSMLIGMITGLCTALAMVSAQQLGRFLDTHIAMLTGAVLLLGIGFWNLFYEYFTRKVLANCEDQVPARVAIPLGRMIIYIMVKPEAADIDHSQDISPREALLLGLALSIDNMIAIFAASLIGALPFYTPVLTGIAQVALIFVGAGIVKVCCINNGEGYWPYASGIILVILGLLRLR